MDAVIFVSLVLSASPRSFYLPLMGEGLRKIESLRRNHVDKSAWRARGRSNETNRKAITVRGVGVRPRARRRSGSKQQSRKPRESRVPSHNRRQRTDLVYVSCRRTLQRSVQAPHGSRNPGLFAFADNFSIGICEVRLGIVNERIEINH